MNAPDRLDAIVLPEGVPKITYKKDTKVENACTFKLFREDHTMGHLLCFQLLRDNRVRFTGYQHPHPLENDILLKIQAAPEAGAGAGAAATPLDVLKTAVDELLVETQGVQEMFQQQVEAKQREREDMLA